MTDFSSVHEDTIAAQATALGRGGVGIIRISGMGAKKVSHEILKTKLKPRYAHYGAFYEENGNVIDKGISLYFPNPNSFTGEDVLELQGHGGPVIMGILLKRVLAIDGIRQANPGEFSERAFLNGKIDLTQAEAIADLIDSTSEEAARSASRSLQGVFSTKINFFVEELVKLRVYIEASIDFPDEQIDFLADEKVSKDLSKLIKTLDSIVKEAGQGVLLRVGMTVVLAGRPNAGKSSLLNALVGRDTAIVTAIEGTTRDVLREHIHIDGMPLHIVDTAGLRATTDCIEKIGVEKALEEIKNSDRVLLMVDATSTESSNPNIILPDFVNKLQCVDKTTIIRNKIDLTGENCGLFFENDIPVFKLSTKRESDVNSLKEYLKKSVGFGGYSGGGFSARQHHLDALSKARKALVSGRFQLGLVDVAEVLADNLRCAQKSLASITGEVTADDLLGHIFSSFCIGK